MKIAKGFFITGTDTGVGKTYVAGLLLEQLATSGYKTAALKPIASGCYKTPKGFRNTDAVTLMKKATVKVPYEQVNPFALEPAVAPHIAAEIGHIELSVSKVIAALHPVLQLSVDYLIVEGVGGLKVPLNTQETTLDLASALGFPIILVVGIRLGCLNHALLTSESLMNNNLPVLGWVANVVDEKMEYKIENIKSLQKTLPFPLLGIVPYAPMPTRAFLFDLLSSRVSKL